MISQNALQSRIRRAITRRRRISRRRKSRRRWRISRRWGISRRRRGRGKGGGLTSSCSRSRRIRSSGSDKAGQIRRSGGSLLVAKVHSGVETAQGNGTTDGYCAFGDDGAVGCAEGP